MPTQEQIIQAVLAFLNAKVLHECKQIVHQEANLLLSEAVDLFPTNVSRA